MSGPLARRARESISCSAALGNTNSGALFPRLRTRSAAPEARSSATARCMVATASAGRPASRRVCSALSSAFKDTGFLSATASRYYDMFQPQPLDTNVRRQGSRFGSLSLQLDARPTAGDSAEGSQSGRAGIDPPAAVARASLQALRGERRRRQVRPRVGAAPPPRAPPPQAPAPP